MQSTAPSQTSGANSELIELIQGQTSVPGATPGKWVGLTLYRFDNPAPPEWDQTASLALCVVVQGRKRVNISGHDYIYDPLTYFVMSRETRFQAHILEGSPERPFLSLVLQIPAVVVAEVLIETLPHIQDQRLPSPYDRKTPDAYVSPLNGDLRDAVTRFLRALDDEGDRHILAPLILREIVYRLLRGEQTPRLVAAARTEKSSRKIMAAIHHMQLQYHQPITVNDIAKSIGISTSAFAHSFKDWIGVSPYHFLKQLRLERARIMMIREGWSVTEAADRIGYASSSHFVRAFTNYFGESPSRYASHFRDRPIFNVFEATLS
jgi:AraC-like DNA-binding protein